MSFEIRDHTADVAICGRGETLGEAFAAVADGMSAAICEHWPDDGERHKLDITAEGREALLFDYLDELIYRRDVLEVLPVENVADVRECDEMWQLVGSFRGVPLALVSAREIKAPTYADMAITDHADGWEVTAVLDV